METRFSAFHTYDFPLSAPPATRPSLLLRMRDRGNHDAWSEFLGIYEPLIYRVAKRFQMQDADAREIVQEVLLRVASAIDGFDPGRAGTFRGWLSQTTRRVAAISIASATSIATVSIP